MSLDIFRDLSSTQSVNTMLSHFKNIVSCCITNFNPPRVKTKDKHTPWITREIIHHKRKIKRLRKAKNRKIATIQDITRRMMKLIEDGKEQFYGVTPHNFLKNSPGKFWRYLGKEREQVDQVIVNEEVIDDSIEIANQFNVFFQSVFTKDDGQRPIPITNSERCLRWMN
ncbi:unnamed protein product [Ixodes hexagonus]